MTEPPPDMPIDPREVPREVMRYHLALRDMGVVALAAKLLALYEPNLRYFRLASQHADDLWKLPHLHAELLQTHPLAGFPFTELTETGLVIAYARPFTKGRPGFPLQSNKFVPKSMRDLHEHLMDIRRKVYAHYEQHPFGREVVELPIPAADGTIEWNLQEAPRQRIFGEVELKLVEELAWAVHDSLATALQTARDRETPDSNA